MLCCPCCLYAPLGSPDNIAFCDCMEELFHVGFPLLVSLAVEGISWYEKFLELLRKFKITQAEYSPTSLSVHWLLLQGLAPVLEAWGVSKTFMTSGQCLCSRNYCLSTTWSESPIPDVLWLACARLTSELTVWCNAQHGPHDSRQCGTSCQREMHEQSLTWGHHSARR